MPNVNIVLLYYVFIYKILIINVIKVILQRKYIPKTGIDKNLK